MGEHSSAGNAALLRSEARRKKILENSAHRLKLIEGINASCNNSFVSPNAASIEGSLEKPKTTDLNYSHAPKAEPHETFDTIDIRMKVRNAIEENDELKKISDFLLIKGDVENNENINREEEAVTLTKPSRENSVLDTLLRKRLHYILLAVIVNILFYFNLDSLFYNNLFCPFYTMKVIEMVLQREETADIQPFVQLFLAGLPETIQKSAKFVMSALPSIISDLFLYLFIFMLGAKIMNLQV